MSKKDRITAGKECEHCLYGTLWDDGRDAKVYCEARDKDYVYGQFVPCNDYKEYKPGEEEQ